MKNIDYNNLLMYISLILAIAILLSILFGCTYRKRGYREYFENAKEEGADTTSAPSSMSSPSSTSSQTEKSSSSAPSSPSSPSTSSDADAHLTQQERELKDKLVGGKVNENQLQQMVDNKVVTTENLQNIIQAFQNELKLR